MQLFFNLMMVAFIGSELELAWGRRRFLFYYSLRGFFRVFVFSHARNLARAESLLSYIGASGAIYGLLVAYGLIFGERVLLFMMLFPLKAKYFVWILALIELMSTVFSTGGSLASIAHIGGW
jgi:membrane associated rhomboid family serine protease